MLAAVSASDVSARQLTPAEALRNAQVANSGAQRKARPLGESTAMRLAYTAQRDNNNLYYVFNNGGDGGGFVILSADDLAPAVLGYVDSGEFDYDKAPENMKWWLSQYEIGIGEAIRTGEPIAGRAAVSRSAVWPMVNTSWNQDAPYNNMCPVIGRQPTYTGCVATAMAQLMNYHRWPEKGTGSHSYELKDKGLSLSADFGSTTYRWDDMLAEYEPGKYTEAQAEAVATLMYHVGVSVDMNYGTDASGAADVGIPYALMSYFGYDKGAFIAERVFYTDEQWEELVYDELAAGRPLYYAGITDRKEAHAFVCDGYDGDGKFHFNWGWGGHYNGYFLITGAGALVPEGSGAGGGTTGYGYTNSQACLTGMQKPQEGSEMRVAMGCGHGYTVTCPDSPVRRDSRLKFNGPIINYSPTTVKVDIGIAFKSATTDDVYYAFVNSNEFEVHAGYADFTFSASSVLRNDKYELYPVYRQTGSEDWLMAMIPAGTVVPEVTIAGEEPSVVLSKQAYIGDGSNITTADNVELHFSLTAFEDIANQEFVGWVFPETGGSWLTCFGPETVTLKAGESRDIVLRKYMGDVLKPGTTYILQLMNYTKKEYLAPGDYGRFYFTVVDPTGISDVVTPADRKVNVYSMAGVLLRSGVEARNATEGLPRGMYIVGGKKVIAR